MPEQGETNESVEHVEISCSLTIGDIQDIRNIEIALGNIAHFDKVLEEGPDAIVRSQRSELIRDLGVLVSRYCTGTIRGEELAALADAGRLTRDETLSIAEGMIELSEEEAKKSAASSPPSLKVIGAA
jgi:hypothetical protein